MATAASASWVQAILLPQPPVARISGAQYHTQLIFCMFSRDGFHSVGQAGLKLLTSGDPATSPTDAPVFNFRELCQRSDGCMYVALFLSSFFFHLSICQFLY